MTAGCAGCGAPLAPSKSKIRARKWCSEKCRKASYGDPCVDCGARTVYGAETKRIPDPRCSPCAREHYRKWTRELVIERIREWATTYGEPPAGPDWMPWRTEHHLHDVARAQRFRDANGYWPSAEHVFQMFGSWNAAIEAAGFAPRAAHGGSGNQFRSRRARAVAA